MTDRPPLLPLSEALPHTRSLHSHEHAHLRYRRRERVFREICIKFRVDSVKCSRRILEDTVQQATVSRAVLS